MKTGSGRSAREEKIEKRGEEATEEEGKKPREARERERERQRETEQSK